MTEIPGYPGYCADESGEIYSVKSGRPRRLSKRKHNGYFRVHVTPKDGRGEVSPYVHTLVLTTFVGKRPPGLVCRHLNGNALDNRLSNICWGTQKENMHDEIRHGTAACLRHGEQANATKLTSDEVRDIRILYREGHSQYELAGAFSVSQRHVSDIVRYKARRFDGIPADERVGAG